MTKNIICFFYGFLLISCSQTIVEKDNYLKDLSISDNKGRPEDSLSYYFPNQIKRDTQIINSGIDPFMQNWFSSVLFAAQEPILYNYYQGHDIYRFLWLRSFDMPLIFSLHKNGNKVWLIIKGLNKEPEFIDRLPAIKYSPPKFLPNGEIDITKIEEAAVTIQDQIIKADRKADIILNQIINLSEKEWIEFENILDNCSFWTTTPFNERWGLDGSKWTLEGHLKNGYWFVNRWSPEDSIKKAGLYLISKSGLKEEIY